MGKCNNIIFDLDGTLFKTDTVFLEALGKVCLDRGISISDEKYVTGLIGRPMAEICRLVFSADLADDEINCIRDEIRKSEKQLISYKGKLTKVLLNCWIGYIQMATLYPYAVMAAGSMLISY